MAAQQDGTNSLRKVPIKGGPVTVLAKGGQDWIPSTGIALDDAFVYFSTGNTILRVAKAGGAPVTIATGLRGVNELVLSGDRIYMLSFIERQPTPVQAVDKAGGKVDTLIDQQMGANDICVDADFIYWATPSGIMRAKKDGKGMIKLYAPPNGSVTRLVLDEEFVYFTERDGSKRSLMKMKKIGVWLIKIAPSINTVFDIGVDSEFVYYFDDENSSGGDITLRKVAKAGAGGTPITLDSGSGGWVGSLAVGQHVLFFQGISQIYSLAK